MKLKKQRTEEKLQTEPIDVVYKIAHKQDTVWCLKELPPIKIYQVQQQYYESTSKITRVQSTKRPNKLKNYLDELIDYHSKIPGPKYKYPSFWSEKSDSKSAPRLNPKSIRKTFLDDVQKQSKAIPGPSDYIDKSTNNSKLNIEMSCEHQKLSNRRNYFENLLAQQLDTPGPGAYSQPSKPIKQFKYKQTKSRSPPQKPGAGPSTYSPNDPSYFTFDKPQIVKPAPKINKCHCSKCVKLQRNSSPGPKVGPSQWNKEGWMGKVCKAPQYSIYYD